MTKLFEFSEKQWDELQSNWSSWWAGELARPLVMIENPVHAPSPQELTRHFLLEQPIPALLDVLDTKLAAIHLYGDAWPKWWPNYGAGIMAGFLGVPLHFAPANETIWFEPDPPWELTEEITWLDKKNVWWQRVSQLTEAAVSRWGDRLCVGYTDLGGNLDILASLRQTQTLLFDLVDNPSAVRARRAEITTLWRSCHQSLHDIISHSGRGYTPWAPMWSPGSCYMLQSDFCTMISPDMFAEFVLPDLEAICPTLDHAFYHLDGPGQLPHLDQLLALDDLDGIQWIPGDGQPPPEAWLAVLARIRDAGKLCQLYVSCAGALNIVRELGGRGFAFYINEPLSPTDAEDFVKVMGERSLFSG